MSNAHYGSFSVFKMLLLTANKETIRITVGQNWPNSRILLEVCLLFEFHLKFHPKHPMDTVKTEWDKVKGTDAFRALPWLTLILVLGGSLGQAQEVLTPREVIERWVRVYPDHLEQAVTMTTYEFRSGVPQEEWVATQKPFLKNLAMQYVRAKIVHEEVRDGEAHVIVQAHIKTRMGDHPQDELYILTPGPNGEWLINAIEIYTESFNTVP